MKLARVGRLAERDLAALDRLVVAGVLAVFAIDAATREEVRGDPVEIALWTLGALILLFRRSRPLEVQVAVLAVIVAIVGFADVDRYFPMGVLLMLISCYSAGAFAPGILGLWIAVLGYTALFAWQTPTDIVFPVAIFAVLPWIAGATMRGNRERARELTELAEQAELETEIEGRRAVLDERRRVARELHDVLAHDLSVIVIQAAAARRLVDRSPETAIEAAELISRTGREAMAELRHLFGPVHRGDEPARAPGLAGVPGLVERATAAGLETELRVEGTPVAVQTGVDLAAYRVLQEALTNALKHAGAGARAKVELTYGRSELRLRVSDDGVGPGGAETPAAPGGGHGLVGMRERVAVYGGELEAGRPRDGGFEVIARIPVEPARDGVREMTAAASTRVGETNDGGPDRTESVRDPEQAAAINTTEDS
ncbi:sensor histidine kinase [Thermoleophilia bacterium SCSIO 60948]|nr:sensor histidine kinase [Thermoleophilia bacterium SCSIO 60948]